MKKLSPYQKADLCTWVAMAMAIAMMLPLPRIMAQCYWCSYFNLDPPVLPGWQLLLWAGLMLIVIVVGFVLPEKILSHAYHERAAGA